MTDMKITTEDEKRPALCYDQSAGEWFKGIVHPCMSRDFMWCAEMEDGAVREFHHNQVRFLDSASLFDGYAWPCASWEPKEEA